MDAKRPTVLNQEPRDPIEFSLHGRRKFGPRLEEVLEVGRRPGQVLAGPVHPQHRIAPAGRRHLEPALVVLQLGAGLLSEQVVGDAHRHLAAPVQLLDDGVVLRIVLKAAAGVDDAGDAEFVELPLELTRGVDLVVERQHWPLSQGRIEDERARPSDQHAGRIAGLVALDRPARRVRRVLGVSDRAQRRGVQERMAVEVEDEDRRVRRHGIDLFERRPAPLGELELGPAADHAHPLRRRRPGGLLLQHAQRVGERRHPFPAQLHVVVQPTANHVGVGIVEARNDAATAEVDDLGALAFQRHDVALLADGGEELIFDRKRSCLRPGPIESCDAAVAQDGVSHPVRFQRLLGRGWAGQKAKARHEPGSNRGPREASPSYTPILWCGGHGTPSRRRRFPAHCQLMLRSRPQRHGAPPV